MRKTTVTDHRRIFDDTTRVMQPFRQDMFRNIDYVDGIQYTTDDIRYLVSQKRLPVVWNAILPQILAFVGAEESNRTSTRVEPTENSDLKMATMINYLLEQDNEETEAAWEISRAAAHAAIFRYGALMASWEPTQLHPDGGYRLRALDPRDVWWDYHPSEPDFDNSEYIIYSRWFTPEHLINKFVKDAARRKELKERAGRLVGDELGVPYSTRYSSSNAWMMMRDKDMTTFGRSGSSSNRLRYGDYTDRGMFRVIELHERREHTYHYIFDPNTAEHIPIPDDMADNKEFIRHSLELRGLQYNERTVISMQDYQMWLSVSAPDLDPKELLFEKPYPVQGKGFAIKIIPGYNFDPDRQRLRSIVDQLIDPQDLINRALSSRAHLMNKILNPDVILGPNAIDDEKDLATIKTQLPGKIIHSPDPSHIIYRYPDLSGANLFTQEANEAMRMMEETPGISRAMKGVRQSDDSGVLVSKRAMYSEAMLTPFWKNISHAILQVEKYHLGLVQYHMTQKRMLRTLEPNGRWKDYGFVNEYDELTGEFKNDITVGVFDIKPDKTKITRSEKQLHLDHLYQIYMQSDPESRMLMQPLVLELIGIPQSEEMVEATKLLQQKIKLQNVMTILQIQQAIQQMQVQGALLPQQAAVQEASMQLQAEQVDLNLIMTALQKIQAQGQLQQLMGMMQAQAQQAAMQQAQQQALQPTQQEQNVQAIPPNTRPAI